MSFQWFQAAQFVVMTLAAILLWSLRYAFRGGEISATAEGRLRDVERASKSIELALEQAREKQSELGSEVTSRIGSLDIAWRETRSDVRQLLKDIERHEREIDDLRRSMR